MSGLNKSERGNFDLDGRIAVFIYIYLKEKLMKFNKLTGIDIT